MFTLMQTTLTFHTQFQSFYNTITSGVPKLANLMSFLGIGILVVDFFAWVIAKRRNGSADKNKLIMALVIGAMLCAPTVVIPMFLFMFDVVGNAVISAYHSLAG